MCHFYPLYLREIAKFRTALNERPSQRDMTNNTSHIEVILLAIFPTTLMNTSRCKFDQGEKRPTAYSLDYKTETVCQVQKCRRIGKCRSGRRSGM